MTDESAKEGWHEWTPTSADGAQRTKPWAPTSDVDFAIFSDKALKQAMELDVPVNPKNKQAGQYTTLKNTPNEKAGLSGFDETPLGKDLKALSKKWDQRVYGRVKPDDPQFDFKLNLQSDSPFRSAVPITQPKTPPIQALSSGSSGSTRVVPIEGRVDYLGVPVAQPHYILPPGTPSRREHHITILSPDEFASLPDGQRARVAAGIDISGAPQPGLVVSHPIGDFDAWQQKVGVARGPEAPRGARLTEKRVSHQHDGRYSRRGEATRWRQAMSSISIEHLQWLKASRKRRVGGFYAFEIFEVL